MTDRRRPPPVGTGLLAVDDRVQVLYQGLNAGIVNEATTTRDEIVARMVSRHPNHDGTVQPA